jgi:1-acyl-sn-glycerol-3-phosphate acyltransferase
MVTVQYGDPIRYAVVESSTREQQQAVAEEIFAEVRELYDGLETLGRREVMRQVRGRTALTS